MVNHPGAITEPVARVIWSPLALPPLPGSDPWSTAELRVLKEAGVELPSAADRLEQVTASWLRPVGYGRSWPLVSNWYWYFHLLKRRFIPSG